MTYKKKNVENFVATDVNVEIENDDEANDNYEGDAKNCDEADISNWLYF